MKTSESRAGSLAHLSHGTQPSWRRLLRPALGAIVALHAASAWAAPVSAPAPAPAPAAPQEPSARYRQGAASADGIGKFYFGREIAQVMGYDGAPWLDRESREREERPDLLIEELGLRPGMIVADVGAGSGYLARRIAPRVPGGEVYAIDVQPEMVQILERLAHEPGLGNIVPRLGSVDGTGLAPGSIDLALLVDVYHELEYPREVMTSIARALRPGGRVVLVEYRGEDPRVPIKALHRMRESQVRREMQGLPLVWERDSERLPLQHIIVFRKGSGPPGAP